MKEIHQDLTPHDSTDFNRDQYEKFAAAYLESNADGRIGGSTPQERAAYIKNYLPHGRTVFEIGAGEGNDTLALTDAGYSVIPTDFTPAFVAAMQKKGLHPQLFDAKQDPLPTEIDAVYANAVFVHFSPGELSDFLQRCAASLRNEQILFFSVIKGEGYMRTSSARGFERDFYYYTVPALEQVLAENGFKLLDHRELEEHSKWIQGIAQQSAPAA